MFKFPPLTAETLIMLPLAMMIDLTSWLLLLVGLDDFGVLDFVGGITVGVWLFFKKKTSGLKGKGGLMGTLRRLYTGKFSKFLFTGATELTPYVGTIMPSWTLAVYFNLT